MGAQLPHRSILIKAQFFALDMATERGTSNETEATHLRACDMLIGSGRRRTRPPYCFAHARPKMPCIRLLLKV